MQLATKFANQLDSDQKYSDEKKQSENQSPAQNNSFQSFLLSKHLAKPELPNNSNVYRAISNERKLWAQPPKNTAYSHSTNTGSSIVIGEQNKLDVYKGSQRPVQHKPQKRKREIRGIPSGHKPVINYKNQSEIMQKIFGSSQAYQEYKNLAEGNPTPKQIQRTTEDFQVETKANSFESPYNNNKQLEQIKSIPPVGPSGQRSNNAQQKVEGQQSGPTQRSLPIQTSNRTDKIQDEADRAFLELQNAKSAFVFENQEFQQKQTKSHSNGFLTTKTTQSSLANNQPKVYENSQLRTTTNFFNPAKDKLIHEEGTLTVEELKEKLFVAEKVMKSLFERNKELELGNEQSYSQSKHSHCQNCEHLQNLLAQKAKETTTYTNQQPNLNNTADEITPEYKQLLQNALQSAQEQAKLHLNQYIDMRNQLQEHLQGAVQVQQDAHEKSKERKLYTLMKQAKQMEVSRDQSYEQRMAQLEKIIEVAEQQFKGFEYKLKQKEQQNTVLKDEITRRKYIEAKVQSYVATLIQQNTKLKEGLQWVKQQRTAGDSVKAKCEEILQELDEEQQSDNQDGEEDSNEMSATEI